VTRYRTVPRTGEEGVELFYNAAITPWFHVTTDVQILDPAQRHNPTALLVGIRGRLSFCPRGALKPKSDLSPSLLTVYTSLNRKSASED
jgi:hypothetical protein